MKEDLLHMYHSLQPGLPAEKRKKKIIFTKEDIFPWEFHLLLLKKEQEDASLPQQQCTNHRVLYWEMITTFNSCSFPMNFCPKQPS